MDPTNIPSQIGRYAVIQHLASGGMADLFLCRQAGPMGFQKVVAVKQIRADHSADSEFLTMFMDEARIAALLTHPNIAQIFELGEVDGQPFLAMEFVNGRSLSAILKRLYQEGKTMPEGIAARIMVGVLRGLHYAHELRNLDGARLNLVHRDVTPQNVLVSNDGQVKLVDFGIAKATNQVARTRLGVIKGKYAYMSPEQVKSNTLDGRSDLFAVGILLYEALTTRRPFKRGSTLETLKAVVTELPPNPRHINPAISPQMTMVVAKALFKRRERRYATAAAMADALESLIHNLNDPVPPTAVASFLDDLFASDSARSERTIVLKDVGELLLPGDEKSDLSEPEAEPQRGEGIPERTVVSMLSEVMFEGRDELSGSISVSLDDEIVAQVAGGGGRIDATVPQVRQFEARLDDLDLNDDRTQISPSPQFMFDGDEDEASAHTAQEAVGQALGERQQPADPRGDSEPEAEPESGGFVVSVSADLPSRPRPDGLPGSLRQEVADNRVALLKFMALGIGIGIVLLIGLIVLSG